MGNNNQQQTRNTQQGTTVAPASAPIAQEGEFISKDEAAAAAALALAAADQSATPTGDASTEQPPAAVVVEGAVGYVAPTEEHVGTEEEKPAVAPAESEEEVPAVPAGPTTATEKPNSEASLAELDQRVKGEDMTTATGTLVTNVMLARIQKHMKHLKGELGFATTKERHEEQVTFMETIGNSTTISYDEFKIVTDVFLKEIIENREVFQSGDALRFIRGLSGKYPQQYINRYEAYITFLTKIARNWGARHRLAKGVDIAFVIAEMPNSAKQNVTKYFNSITNS